ncbi:hypothetical protein Poli38472_011638 [Pythium oligandrum]|uniref:Uncharacterized protein n=1 Tax=Pythium oligandrum TaxID=41045 RepID=A0A8K1CLY4_PYTOL|nr:hypothetical protein Poli38472_011632 [Pythium oligandrum]TMW64758.1 hypothetical protein Poli38472_011638 [Pythium oligandrum]|eukprot:TMW64752.1 hypothetical protein Poli38472_011632 [Pythium oligandrum]
MKEMDKMLKKRENLVKKREDACKARENANKATTSRLKTTETRVKVADATSEMKDAFIRLHMEYNEVREADVVTFVQQQIREAEMKRQQDINDKNMKQ